MRRLIQIKIIRVIGKICPFIAVVFIWWLISYFKFFPDYFFPSPADVFFLFFKMIFDGSLLKYTAISLLNAFAGFSLGVLFGLLLSGLCAASAKAYNFFYPILSAFYPIPTIIWVPLSLLWFGFSITSIIFVVFLASFFAIFYNSLAGIKNINPVYKRAALNLNLRGFAYFKEVFFWGSFPFVLVGLRLAMGASWRVIVGAEMLSATSHGLGWFLWRSSEFFRYDQVFVGIITIAIVGVLLEKFIFLEIEKKTIARWY